MLESPKQNGVTHLLSILAKSADKWVQLGTLVLIGLSGFGNWVATWNSADRNKVEIEINRRVAWEGEQRIKQEVIKQVNEIHQWMKEATEEFHNGNADSAANKRLLLGFKEELVNFEKRQLTALDNQTTIIKGQTQILKELQDFVNDRKKKESQ